MSAQTLFMPENVHRYMLSMLPPLGVVEERLRAETAAMPRGGMQISAEQGHFMRLLIELIGAKKTLEVGVFTGYSALQTAMALPEGGKIIACDVSEEFTSVARPYWEEAGVAHKIDLRIGPAAQTLAALAQDTAHIGTFDFAFIDADKSGYDTYYEFALTLLRPGGLIGIDNTLWSGKVADGAAADADTAALRTLNAKLAQDARVSVAVVPIGDGLTLARKR